MCPNLSYDAQNLDMNEPIIKFYGVRRDCFKFDEVTDFYATLFGERLKSQSQNEKILARNGWLLSLVRGGEKGYYTGWITFAVESIEKLARKLKEKGIRYFELIPPWLEEGAQLLRLFDPDGLMFQLEESHGQTAGRDDIVIGVADVRRSLRSYCKGLGLHVIKSYSIYAELSFDNGPVLGLLQVEKVLKPFGTLIFTAPTLNKAIERLESVGFRVFGQPRRLGSGKMLAQMADADSNPIELIADSD